MPRVALLKVALASSFATAALLATESDARALDFEAGVKVGGATNPSHAAGSSDQALYGFGLGARAGLELNHVYAGLSVVHYLGSTADVPSPAPPGTIKASIATTFIGVEAGYTFTQLPLVELRPQVGFGAALFSTDIESRDLTTGFAFPKNANHLFAEPGLTVLVPIGPLYVGADVNALIVPSDKTLVSLSAHGQVGVRF